MLIAPLLQRFVDEELNRATDLIGRTVTTTLEQLRQPRDGLLTANERQHHFELVQVLQQHQALYQRTFATSLRSLVQAEMAPQPLAPGSPASASPGLGGLELMDESRVESDIEISRAIQQIDTVAEWELRELQTFTSTLRGQTHVTAESNPLRPQSYARALWHAASALPATPAQQVILLRVSATVMAGMLRMAFAAASTRLESQGVTPGIYRTVVIVPGAGREQPELDVTRPGALDGLMRSMPGGADASSGLPDTRRQAAPAATPALEQALGRVEQLLRRLPAASPNAPAGEAPKLADHRVALMATTAEMVDRQIIELLSRLFDTVLSDLSLHAGIRAVLARMQVSALRIALLDPSMLDAYDHPVWELMDRIVNAAGSYPRSDDPRLASLLAFCESMVTGMAAESSQDAALYRRSLLRIDAFLSEQLYEQLQHAQAAIDALAGAEQTEQLQRTLASRLAEQMACVPAGAALRRFATATWARVLAEAVRRFGEQSAETAGYLKTVDQLLWSLKLPDHPQSRQRLVAVLPGMLQRLRAGMSLIDLPTAEQERVLDELMKAHSEALRPRPAAEPEEALSPEQIVRRMREEVVPEVPELETVAFSDSLIDLASMDTVPADLMPEPVADTPSEKDAAQWAQRLTAGERYRIFLHGSWTKVQLLWHSEMRRFYLFAGETPQRTHSVTQRALERLRAADLLGPLYSQPLVQRAVDAMLRNLSKPT